MVGRARPVGIAFLLGTAAFTAVPAWSQDRTAAGDAAAADRAAPALATDEILVTARKRAENVQDVSEAVTVATGAQLEKLQIVQPQDLVRIAPGLTYRTNPIPTSSAFVIRGIGTSTFSPGVEQSVSTVTDGVVLGQPQSAGSFVDIDHVEVLEGPQGLLFGKNASAGLINIITRAPQVGEFSLDGHVTVGTHGEFRADGVLNAPLGADAAVRLVAFRNSADGILDNKFRPQDKLYNNIDNWGVRGRLRWEPTDTFTIDIGADYARDPSVCCFATARVQGASAALAAANAKYGVVPGPDNTSTIFGRPNGRYIGAPLREYYGGNVTLEKEFGDYALTSITAYRENSYILDFDGDETPATTFDYDGGAYRYHQFSQELRIASPETNRLSWLAGLYYFNSTNRVNFLAGGDFIPGLPPIIGVTRTQIYNKDYAAFGNVEFKVTPQFRLRAGARVTHDELKGHLKSFDAPGTLPGSSVILGGIVADFTQGGKATGVSYKVTAEYDVAPDVMIYANAGRGYKGPGLSALAGTKPSVNQYVKPEFADSYDIGLKSQFFDRRVTLNLAAFLSDFKDFQTQVYDTSVTPPSFRVTNAGSLRTKGIEGQIIVRPANGFSLFGNAAYIDGEYRDLRNISCVYADTVPTPHGQCARVGTQLLADASGNRLADSPKWSFTTGADYSTDFGTLVVDLHTDYSWHSSVQFAPNGDPQTIQPGYGIWNASIGVAAQSGLWDLRGFVRNIGDVQYADLIAPNAADTMGGYSQYLSRGRERQAGVTLGVHFR